MSFRKKKVLLRCPRLIWIAKREASLSQHMFTSFFWVPLIATILFVDFMVKSYDSINDSYHSVNPVWQNKVQQNTAPYRGFIRLLIHIIL